MRKVLLPVILFSLVSGLLFAQKTLPRLAVVEFSTNVNNEKIKADAIAVRNFVESAMIGTRKFQMIARDEIDKLINNQQIQVSSISSPENIKKLQLQNISYIVTGSLDAMGNDYMITVKILDVSTGQFSHSDNGYVKSGSQELYNGMSVLMTRFTAGISSRGDGVAATYKIGDFGPAGGIIFYDKGVFSGGWRYLEAAPAETEFQAPWGAYDKDVTGTETGVGFGKRNTQIIVEFLKRIGESGKAAQLCASLNFDGFNDWFLPSKDELDLMYKNLKQKGLGGFSNNWYLSSSQHNTTYAWDQNFSNGVQRNYVKLLTDSVRAVRAF